MVKKRTMPTVLRILFAFLFIAGVSVLLTWFTLWQQNMCDADKTWGFIQTKLDLATYSYLIICLLTLILAAATWRPFLSTGISFSLLSILMFIHMQKYQIRAAPLIPEDFQMADQAGALMEFVDIWAVVRLAAGVVFILVGSGILEHAMQKIIGRPKKDLPVWERYALVPRVSFTLLLVAVFSILARPVLWTRSVSKSEIDWLPSLSLVAWNQTENYDTNGFVIAFLYNLGRVQEEEPDNYSEQMIREIAEKYKKIADQQNTDLKSLSEVADNVIFVMDESFYDPAVLGPEYNHSGGDITPNLHKIFAKYPSGYMYSPEYGGSTANVEFAAFTGLTNFWAQTTPYVRSIAAMSHVPGLASWAKNDGFATTAIHAYDGTMYKRNVVYSKMGFDVFLDADKMKHQDQENGHGYISDQAVYQEILDVLDQSNTSKNMVAAVTMQNHVPYWSPLYDTQHFQVNNPGKHDDPYSLQASWEMLYHADQYLGEFISKLDKLSEKTVLIWFGDHAAGVLDAYMSSGDKSKQDLAHLTPYFVYANFDVKSPWTTKETAELNKKFGFSYKTNGVNLPTVSPNCLPSILYDIINAKKPELLYLGSEVCEETPILAPSYITKELEITSDALRDYQLINYDMLSGKRYFLQYDN